jgi:hypothetical protein
MLILKKSVFFTLGAFAALSSAFAGPAPLLGSDLSSFSALSGGYVTYGASADISSAIGAISYITAGAGSKSGGDFIATDRVNSALNQMASAKADLNSLKEGTVLAPTLAGSKTLNAGTYSMSALTTEAGTTLTLDGGGVANALRVFNISNYLVTGAGTKIEIINAGAGSSVLWNTGGYVTMGADTSFMGTILSGGYVSMGAGSNVTCGNIFSSGYMSLSAGGKVNSSNCAASGSWGGSEMGMGYGVSVVNGKSVMVASMVPEPAPVAMLLAGLGIVGFKMRRLKDLREQC